MSFSLGTLHTDLTEGSHATSRGEGTGQPPPEGHHSPHALRGTGLYLYIYIITLTLRISLFIMISLLGRQSVMMQLYLLFAHQGSLPVKDNRPLEDLLSFIEKPGCVKPKVCAGFLSFEKAAIPLPATGSLFNPTRL